MPGKSLQVKGIDRRRVPNTNERKKEKKKKRQIRRPALSTRNRIRSDDPTTISLQLHVGGSWAAWSITIQLGGGWDGNDIKPFEHQVRIRNLEHFAIVPFKSHTRPIVPLLDRGHMHTHQRTYNAAHTYSQHKMHQPNYKLFPSGLLPPARERSTEQKSLRSIISEALTYSSHPRRVILKPMTIGFPTEAESLSPTRGEQLQSRQCHVWNGATRNL